jgi:hypothetical protein
MELVERETRIAELTRKNVELAHVAAKDVVTIPVVPVAAAKAKVLKAHEKARSTPTKTQQDDEPSSPPSGRRPGRRRDSSTQRVRANESEMELDEIDILIRKYLQERPDVNIELQKLRKGWYLAKPINKKVFLKQAGKDKLVVRVGGGHVSLAKFLEDFSAGQTSIDSGR